MGRVGPTGPALLVARELLAVAGFLAAARKGVVLEVDFAGKASSALVMVATGGMMLVDAPWAEDLYKVSVVVATGTLAHYAWSARARLRAAGAGEADSRG